MVKTDLKEQAYEKLWRRELGAPANSGIHGGSPSLLVEDMKLERWEEFLNGRNSSPRG